MRPQKTEKVRLAPKQHHQKCTIWTIKHVKALRGVSLKNNGKLQVPVNVGAEPSDVF